MAPSAQLSTLPSSPARPLPPTRQKTRNQNSQGTPTLNQIYPRPPPARQWEQSTCPLATWATQLVSPSLVFFLAKRKHRCKPCLHPVESSLLGSVDITVIKRLLKLEKSSPYARDCYYYINSRAFPEACCLPGICVKP